MNTLGLHNVTCVFFRLGRRWGFLLSISLSCLLGVAVCLSSSAVVFLLLRLSQGAMLAGVLLSSYIASEYPAHTFSFLLAYCVIDFSPGI